MADDFKPAWDRARHDAQVQKTEVKRTQFKCVACGGEGFFMGGEVNVIEPPDGSKGINYNASFFVCLGCGKPFTAQEVLGVGAGPRIQVVKGSKSPS